MAVGQKTKKVTLKNSMQLTSQIPYKSVRFDCMSLDVLHLVNFFQKEKKLFYEFYELSE